ncbi:hypothetical protein KKF61_09250 [Patescibacteria group bacterium]|nr:hypothetical protein [Patescibacteria group bacterium]
MTRYIGSLFGFNYDMDFKTDEEFVAWLVAKLKKMNPLLPKIMDALLNESADFVALKTAEIAPSK